MLSLIIHEQTTYSDVDLSYHHKPMCILLKYYAADFLYFTVLVTRKCLRDEDINVQWTLTNRNSRTHLDCEKFGLVKPYILDGKKLNAQHYFGCSDLSVQVCEGSD